MSEQKMRTVEIPQGSYEVLELAADRTGYSVDQVLAALAMLTIALDTPRLTRHIAAVHEGAQRLTPDRLFELYQRVERQRAEQDPPANPDYSE